MSDLIQSFALCLGFVAVGSVGCSVEDAAEDAELAVVPAERGFLLTNVNLLEMATGELAEGRSVLVRNGVIEWIGEGNAPQSDGARVIDGEGGFLLPGFIDMHVHLADEDELDLYLLNGVTSVTNLSGASMHLEMRRKIESGELVGPTIYTAGRTIDGDPPRNPRFIGIGDPAEADALVGGQIEDGYDLVKIYDLIEKEPYDAVVAAAKERGVPVVGHIPKAFGLEGILEGHDLIAHAEEYYYTFFDYEPDRERIAEAARLTAEAGIAVCPNTGFIHAIIQQAEDIDAVLAWPEVRYLPPASYLSWLPENNRYTKRPPEWLSRNKVMHPFLLEITKGLHDAGVSIVVGTDASVPGGVPGFALRREIESLESAGLSRMDALRAATLNPATWIAEHLGDDAIPAEVEVGRRADLVLLSEDPRSADDPLASITAVAVRGTWRERTEIQAVVDSRAETYAREIESYHAFRAALDAGDRPAAEAAVESASEIFAERVLNGLGYDYLYGRGDPTTAVLVFELNAARHPESSNVWDSLGEGQKASGDLEAALISYRRSLELNPENRNAEEQIAELGG